MVDWNKIQPRSGWRQSSSSSSHRQEVGSSSSLGGFGGLQGVHFGLQVCNLWKQQHREGYLNTFLQYQVQKQGFTLKSSVSVVPSASREWQAHFWARLSWCSLGALGSRVWPGLGHGQSHSFLLLQSRVIYWMNYEDRAAQNDCQDTIMWWIKLQVWRCCRADLLGLRGQLTNHLVHQVSFREHHYNMTPTISIALCWSSQPRLHLHCNSNHGASGSILVGLVESTMTHYVVARVTQCFGCRNWGRAGRNTLSSWRNLHREKFY